MSRHLELDAWLAALCNNENEVERARACAALGRLGRAACPAVGALVRAVELDDEPCVRRWAVVALLEIQADGVNLRPALDGLMVQDRPMRAWLREQIEARFPASFRAS